MAPTMLPVAAAAAAKAQTATQPGSVASGAQRPLPRGPRNRTEVVWQEACRLAHDSYAALRQPKQSARDGGLGRDLRLLMHDRDYRAQLYGRAMTQFALGLGGGAQTLLLSSTTSLTAQQGLLVNSLINAAELLVAQGAGLGRALFSDKARNGLKADAAGGSAPMGRAQLTSRLLLAGLYEACLAGCLLGVLAFRGARLLAGRRILLVLAAVRIARIFCMATQWASFDGLKGQLGTPQGREVVQRRWDVVRACEVGAGLSLNNAAGIACQLLPYVVPCPSMTIAMGCMLGASVVVSMAAKLQLSPYLDEALEPVSAPMSSASAEWVSAPV